MRMTEEKKNIDVPSKLTMLGKGDRVMYVRNCSQSEGYICRSMHMRFPWKSMIGLDWRPAITMKPRRKNMSESITSAV